MSEAYSFFGPGMKEWLLAGIEVMFRTATQSTNKRLEELQRLVAKPRRYRFVMQLVKPSEKAK